MEPTSDQYDERTEAIRELSRGMVAMVEDVSSLRSELQTSLVEPAVNQIEDRRRSNEDRRLLRRIWQAATGVYLPILLVLGMAVWAAISVHQIRSFVQETRNTSEANRLCSEPSTETEIHECYEDRIAETARRLESYLEEP
jgi:hypothetical protein